MDISNLLRNKSKQNDILVRKILKIIENPTVRHFWEHDYKKYGKNEFGPPINKLSKLLISGPVSLMLSQPENRFHFRKMMDQGTILLVDLSNIGVTLQQVLGSFLLSLLHLTALSRRDTPIEDRKPFHVFCDEAPNFITTDSSIEKMIVETRKYEVSLSLAHQYLSQLSAKKRDALSGVGTSINFKVNKSDAEYYAKNLQGRVKPEDLTGLAVGESFFRVDTDAGTEIVKMETLKPLKIPKQNFRERIIESSYKSYYRPAPEIKKWLKRAGDRWLEPHAPLVEQSPRKLENKAEDFEYDELF